MRFWMNTEEEEEKYLHPEWEDRWLSYLKQYQDQFCESRRTDLRRYICRDIDGEKKFENFPAGTVFLCSEGYMVKVSETKYHPYNDDIESFADYVRSSSCVWSSNAPVLVTDFQVV